MKHLGKLATIVGCGLFITGVANAADERTLDYAKINQTIGESIANVLSEQAELQKFDFEINPHETQPEEDRYGFDFSMAAPKAAWSDRPVFGDGNMSVKVELDEENDKHGIHIRKAVTLKTEVAAFIKHIAARKMKKNCPVDEKVVGINALMVKEDCRFGEELQNATNVAEIFAMVKTHRENHLRDLEAFTSNAAKDLTTISSPVLREEAQAAVDRANKIIKTLKSTTLGQSQNDYIINAEDADIVVATLFHGYKDLVTLNGIKIAMNEDEVIMDIDVTLGFGTKLYKHAKPEVERLLTALEDGEDYAREIIKIDARIIMSCISEFLNK